MFHGEDRRVRKEAEEGSGVIWEVTRESIRGDQEAGGDRRDVW